MIEQIVSFFSGVPESLVIVILAAIPVTELRASIPVALLYFHLSIFESVFFSLVGNTIPIILLFGLFQPFLHWLTIHCPKLHQLMQLRFSLLEQKHQQTYQRWGAIFLFVFVAIPLPGSGAWTGSVLAILFRVHPRLSIPSIVLGLCCSAGIVLLLSLGIDSITV